MNKKTGIITGGALAILIALGIATSGYTNADRLRGSSVPLNSKGALYNNGGGVLSWDSTVHVTSTVVTPSVSANTVLLDNSYNVIAPTTTLSTYTVTMPANPNNGDVVYIKFTQLITTLTYSIATGSVVASPTTITANQPAWILTYNSAKTSWY